MGHANVRKSASDNFDKHFRLFNAFKHMAMSIDKNAISLKVGYSVHKHYSIACMQYTTHTYISEQTLKMFQHFLFR